MRFSFWIFLFTILTSCSSPKPQLNLFVWSEYFSPDLIKEFEAEHDCRVIVDTFDTNEAMYAKLKLGATGYDVVMPSNYIFETMVEQGMLRPIDFDQLSEIKNLNQEEVQQVGLTLNGYGIPYMLSYAGIGCIPSRIENFEASWRLFDRQDLKGRMTMLNDMREALGAALITLGYSINTNSEKELEEAVDLLLRWKKNIAKFESEQYKSGLASAEYLVSHGYNTDVLQVMLEDSAVAFVYPLEGCCLSVDYLALPASAPHPELATKFINFFMRSDIVARNTNFSLTAGLVRAEQSLLNPELRDSEVLYPPLALREKAQLIRNVGHALELFSDAWERVLTE